MTPVEVALLAFLLVTGVATALFRDVLSSIVVFAAYGLGMALLYAFYRAPDVAMTEAAIGAGVTTVLLLLTIARTSRPATSRTFAAVDRSAALATGSLAVLLVWTLTAVPAVGDPSAPAVANADVTGYYLANAYADLGVENTVMAVLAAYRGFDTFGEAVVVFAALVAAMVVLRREVMT